MSERLTRPSKSGLSTRISNRACRELTIGGGLGRVLVRFETKAWMRMNLHERMISIAIIGSRVDFDDVFVVEDVISLDQRSRVNGGSPDAGGLEVRRQVVVNQAGEVQERGAPR